MGPEWRRLLRLLAWMRGQAFESLLRGHQPLLPAVEELVVDAHRRWHAGAGDGAWSPPVAYHWLHYEDPDPVRRLEFGAARLAELVEVEAAGVDRVLNQAHALGYRESQPE
jgi:hypothetical protein